MLSSFPCASCPSVCLLWRNVCLGLPPIFLIGLFVILTQNFPWIVCLLSFVCSSSLPFSSGWEILFFHSSLLLGSFSASCNCWFIYLSPRSGPNCALFISVSPVHRVWNILGIQYISRKLIICCLSFLTVMEF